MSNLLKITKKYDVICVECDNVTVVKEKNLEGRCPKCGSDKITITER